MVEVQNLRKSFRLSTRKSVTVVDDVSFSIPSGKTLGLVGESGCGKTTLGRSVLRLIEPTSGKIFIDGKDITTIPKKELRPLRKRMQMVFQDPYGSLNPRMTVEETLIEPLLVHKEGGWKERQTRILEVLETVGLSKTALARYPHEFSGGQRQRIGIARALILKPQFIVADEPVSALDVSVQSQVLNLLSSLQRQLNLALLFISHDLAVVQHISDEVAVMYLGKTVERGSVDALYQNPKHPYTQLLLASVPRLKKGEKKIVVGGEPPSVLNPPRGCAFHPRCPLAEPHCREVAPVLSDTGSKHWVSCHLYPGGLESKKTV